MFNFIISSVVAGTLSASAAAYLNDVEHHSEVVAKAYVDHAQQRFDEYDKMIPGVVGR